MGHLPETATITSVSGAASDTALIAANTDRKALFVFNDSSATLYLAAAGTASTTNYTVQIQPSGFWELPMAQGGRCPTMAFRGIWSAANGAARITEVT